MPGSYKLVCHAAKVPGLERYIGHLYATPKDNTTASEEEKQFYGECEVVATGLRKHLQKAQEPPLEFMELLRTAQLGLVGEGANLPGGKIGLEVLKKKLVLEVGPALRKRYLVKLCRVAGFVAVLCLLVGVLLPFPIARAWNTMANVATTNTPAAPIGGSSTSSEPSSLDAPRDSQPLPVHGETPESLSPSGVRCFSFMLFASMLGLVGSYLMRKNFTFEQLFLPEEDLLGPGFRVAFVLGMTSLFALLCSLDFVGLVIAGFSTQKLFVSLRSAMVFGAFCGLGELLLADTVMPHVKRFFTSLGEHQPTQSLTPQQP